MARTMPSTTIYRRAQVVVVEVPFWRSDAKRAALYGVPTKAVVQALKRTPERFPDGFLFLLSSVRAPRRSGVSFGQSSVEGREHRTHGGPRAAAQRPPASS